MESTNTLRLRKPKVPTAMNDKLRRRPFRHHVRGVISNHPHIISQPKGNKNKPKKKGEKNTCRWVGGRTKMDMKPRRTCLKYLYSSDPMAWLKQHEFQLTAIPSIKNRDSLPASPFMIKLFNKKPQDMSNNTTDEKSHQRQRTKKSSSVEKPL